MDQWTSFSLLGWEKKLNTQNCIPGSATDVVGLQNPVGAADSESDQQLRGGLIRTLQRRRRRSSFGIILTCPLLYNYQYDTNNANSIFLLRPELGAMFGNGPLPESAERVTGNSTILTYSSANSAPGAVERSDAEQPLSLRQAPKHRNL